MENATLNCSSSVDDATYSWHNVHGSVPSRSIGQNSHTLTIPKVIPYDTGEYYCIAKKDEITVESNKAAVRVDGKIIIIIIIVNNNLKWIFIDLLSISIESKNIVIGKGRTAYFNATANGVSTSESKFMYHWKKRGSNLPNKVLDVNGPVLTIPSVVESDEGQYYCTVTNEWGRSVESNDATLTVFGMSL